MWDRRRSLVALAVIVVLVAAVGDRVAFPPQSRPKTGLHPHGKPRRGA